MCSTCVLSLALIWSGAASAQSLDLRIPRHAVLGFQQPGPAGQPVTGTLTLEEAIQRGLEYNLNVVDARYTVASAEGQRRVRRVRQEQVRPGRQPRRAGGRPEQDKRRAAAGA